MTDLAKLIERNAEFAAHDYPGKLGIMPQFSTLILSCVDARVDPAHFLKLAPGDAMVFRSAGARINDEIELEIGILWAMAQTMAGDDFRGFELALIQHTDCGFERLANPQLQQGLSQRLGIEPEVVQALATHDHEATLAADIERLRQSPVVPKDLVVSGYMYDVESGTMRQIVSPTALSR